MNIEENIRKRPAMYIGNDGIAGIFEGILKDSIEFCRTDEIRFEFIISGENTFTLKLSSPHDLHAFTQQFNSETETFLSFYPKALKAISKTFEIITHENAKIEINFSFDETVINSPRIDYIKLIEKALQLALLNRQCEIITTDKRQHYLSQNYFHFPEGIFYLFHRAISEVLGKPEFIISFDDIVGSYQFQIGVAFRTDWYPAPQITSFANSVHTVCGGSLVDGIKDGLVTGCKKYIKENKLTGFKVTRKKLENGLILICSVRGKDFKYGGSLKETLANEQVRIAVRKSITELVYNFLEKEKEMADKFFQRFDRNKFKSGMF